VPNNESSVLLIFVFFADKKEPKIHDRIDFRNAPKYLKS